jgi:hypothetical protein
LTHRRCRGNNTVSSGIVDYVPHPPIAARCPSCNLANP